MAFTKSVAERGDKVVEILVVFLKIAALSLLAFGAYVFIAQRERRVSTSPTVQLKRRKTDAEAASPVVHITDASARASTDFSIGFRNGRSRDKLAAMGRSATDSAVGVAGKETALTPQNGQPTARFPAREGADPQHVV